MLTVVQTIEEMEKEIKMIQNGQMPLDKASESAKIRKLVVQSHGHILAGIRGAGRLQAMSQQTALNDTIGKPVINITPIVDNSKDAKSIPAPASGARKVRKKSVAA
jgi:hypothetical protein